VYKKNRNWKIFIYWHT